MKSKKQNRQGWWIGGLLLLAAFLLFQPGTTAVHADGSITGTVFRDFNSNGTLDVNEPGIGGITVTAVSDGGSSFSTTTAANGTYTLPTLIGTQARGGVHACPQMAALDIFAPPVSLVVTKPCNL
ncbi:MAG: hypothetical protein HC804_06440 [Anaerolineae bacterium]|nr:hypothetical protein [Anaerolineae bacterium]